MGQPGKTSGMMLGSAKIMTSEVTALQKSAYEKGEPLKSRQVALNKQPDKKTSEDDDDCGIEIEGDMSGFGALFGQKPPTSKSLFKEHFP